LDLENNFDIVFPNFTIINYWSENSNLPENSDNSLNTWKPLDWAYVSQYTMYQDTDK